MDRFEEEVANYIGIKKAVVCVNGTNALHLALLLSGVRQKMKSSHSLLHLWQQRMQSPITMQSLCLLMSMAGNLDLSPTALETFLVEMTEIRDHECYNKITGRRIKHRLMHTFGHPCEIGKIGYLRPLSH
ncbi:MAG: DegT/DnrJ/EryC1/StrS family aminotransferase [Comamonadaceae bacterium]|nr:DegT/DnrJ/EryC1/StrS family aminotransferase [Comamonadaceae bacterium]